MNPTDDWIRFWTVVLSCGIGAFYCTALVVIPLGARDVKRLFQALSGRDNQLGEDSSR